MRPIERRTRSRAGARRGGFFLVSHRRPPLRRFDQRKNVRHAPGGRSVSQLYGFGIAARFAASPPARFADGDDRRDRRMGVRVANNLRQTQEPGFRESIFHFDSPIKAALVCGGSGRSLENQKRVKN